MECCFTLKISIFRTISHPRVHSSLRVSFSNNISSMDSSSASASRVSTSCFRKEKTSLGFAISMLITIHECSTMHIPTILDSISKTKQSKSKYFNTNVQVISHDIVPQKLLNSQTNCKKTLDITCQGSAMTK
jgi:hypothetical protein